jgi:mannose-6-phosphate isomerase-like protein (cupin superfamily)
MTITEPVDLAAAFDGLADHWSPRIVAQVNDHYVKVAKLLGELAWHRHDGEDELFQIVNGRPRIEYEGGRSVELGPGSIHVVPRGVMHNPVAEEECRILLIEPIATLHTGDVETSRTKTIEQQRA